MNSRQYGSIRGGLFGTAIGDAMGGPVEMWSPDRIAGEHGWVRQLLPYTSPPNPTYVWEEEAPSGTYTDDTRLKALIAELILESGRSLTAGDLARAFREAHRGASEGSLEQLWYAEWAEASEAFLGGTNSNTEPGIHGFYGGEMVCGGMIMIPPVGFLYEGDPETAYHAGYGLAFFDLGYARDATGVVTALVAASISENSTIDTVLDAGTYDPHSLDKRQIFGRVCGRWMEMARDISRASRTRADLILGIHKKLLRSTPCDPAEMLGITVAILDWTKGDPVEAIPLAVNCGRDNDSVAGVVGLIAGTLYGIDALPEAWVDGVRSANPDPDLDDLAHGLLNQLIAAN